MIRTAPIFRVRFGLHIRGVVVVVLAGALGACSSTPSPTAALSGDTESFSSSITSAITGARSGDASDAQITILESAQGSGELSFELAHEAALNTVACMTTAGVGASYILYSTQGLDVPGYEAQVGLDDNSELEAIADACDEREFRWVSLVYQTQPLANEARNAFFAEKAPLVRACLQGHDISVDPGATMDELQDAMTEALTDSNGEVNCFSVLE